MNGKIFLVLALVGSLAVATNIVGTSFANKPKDDDRKQGGACQSYENRDNPGSLSGTCHSFSGDDNVICGPSSASNIESCAKQNNP